MRSLLLCAGLLLTLPSGTGGVSGHPQRVRLPVVCGNGQSGICDPTVGCEQPLRQNKVRRYMYITPTPAHVRTSTRPFLSLVEKKWIAFQILNALRDARNRKVSHGDIKSENILVTSWNWVYVSDFASYKPTYLPLDDPSDFSFFFDTSGRRSCYIAPERFYTASENPDISAKKSKLATEDGEGKRDGKVTEAMDCFSAGCVIAELFLEGKPLFTLSELFKYREGELKVETQLTAVEDDGVRVSIALRRDTAPTETITLSN